MYHYDFGCFGCIVCLFVYGDPSDVGEGSIIIDTKKLDTVQSMNFYIAACNDLADYISAIGEVAVNDWHNTIVGIVNKATGNYACPKERYEEILNGIQD